jgi:hypothetical protein
LLSLRSPKRRTKTKNTFSLNCAFLHLTWPIVTNHSQHTYPTHSIFTWPLELLHDIKLFFLQHSANTVKLPTFQLLFPLLLNNLSVNSTNCSLLFQLLNLSMNLSTICQLKASEFGFLESVHKHNVLQFFQTIGPCSLPNERDEAWQLPPWWRVVHMRWLVWF